MTGMERPRQIIECGDFALRRWRGQSDFEPVFRLIEESLDHLRPWMPWVASHSEEKTRDFLAKSDTKWDSGDAYNYAITQDDSSSVCARPIAEPTLRNGTWGTGCTLPPSAEASPRERRQP
jgi:hypothetical protein